MKRRQFIRAMFVGAVGLTAAPTVVASMFEATSIVPVSTLSDELILDSILMPEYMLEVRRNIVRQMAAAMDDEIINGLVKRGSR